ncbi:hypothetical protein P7C71_g521, partial [Lecanoromycetidae sp. Uapishka_2]
MRDRRDREARRVAERQREEQRQAQEEETIQQERMPVAAGVAPGIEPPSNRRSRGDERRSGGDPSVQERSGRNPGNRGSGVTRADLLSSTTQPPNGRYEKPSVVPEDNAADLGSVPQPRTRPRGATLSTGQPRPVESKPRQTPRAASASATTANTKESLPQYKNAASVNATAGASQPRVDRQGLPSTSQSRPAQESVEGSQNRTNTSSFPHAFERWETLSSHWEGLTSFWIRRLEQNKEDFEREPLNAQMARQVTDLSAAGANLFHAVVELQRLRASSERKFQRWFFETRAEQERFRENQGKFDERLQEERAAREAATEELARLRNEKSSVYSERKVADLRVKEMTRELTIAKDEARRAWEELGRREQEERDRTQSLKNGEVTIVGGVQVVPMMQGASRQGSTNRPSTRDGPGSTTTQLRAAQMESPMEEQPGYTTYDSARSETDTDPFTEGGRERSVQPVTAPLPYQQTSNTSAAALQAARAVTASQTNAQQTGNAASSAPGGTYLSYGPDGPVPSGAQPGSSSFYQHEGSVLQGQGRVTEADERSYVPSIGDTLSEEDYDLDENGEVRRDAQGQPIIGRRGLGSEGSDEYDVQDQLERERMYGRSYGSSMSGVEYGSGPPAAPARQAPDAPADYSGTGFGAGWEAMPRHHHPTRLSDVLEEDERSRTSPSRASQNSRGIR